MLNRIKFRKLGRKTKHRGSMFRNMATSLIEHERIRTTLPKAKELRHFADRVVTWAKRGERHMRQKALGFVRSKEGVAKLWNNLAPRYSDRAGGYCRVLRCGFRTGDRAPMAIIEYVNRPGEVRPARPGSAQPAVEAERRAPGEAATRRSMRLGPMRRAEKAAARVAGGGPAQQQQRGPARAAGSSRAEGDAAREAAQRHQQQQRSFSTSSSAASWAAGGSDASLR